MEWLQSLGGSSRKHEQQKEDRFVQRNFGKENAPFVDEQLRTMGHTWPARISTPSKRQERPQNSKTISNYGRPAVERVRSLSRMHSADSAAGREAAAAAGGGRSRAVSGGGGGGGGASRLLRHVRSSYLSGDRSPGNGGGGGGGGDDVRHLVTLLLQLQEDQRRHHAEVLAALAAAAAAAAPAGGPFPPPRAGNGNGGGGGSGCAACRGLRAELARRDVALKRAAEAAGAGAGAGAGGGGGGPGGGGALAAGELLAAELDVATAYHAAFLREEVARREQLQAGVAGALRAVGAALAEAAAANEADLDELRFAQQLVMEEDTATGGGEESSVDEGRRSPANQNGGAAGHGGRSRLHSSPTREGGGGAGAGTGTAAAAARGRGGRLESGATDASCGTADSLDAGEAATPRGGGGGGAGRGALRVAAAAAAPAVGAGTGAAEGKGEEKGGGPEGEEESSLQALFARALGQLSAGSSRGPASSSRGGTPARARPAAALPPSPSTAAAGAAAAAGGARGGTGGGGGGGGGGRASRSPLRLPARYRGGASFHAAPALASPPSGGPGSDAGGRGGGLEEEGAPPPSLFGRGGAAEEADGASPERIDLSITREVTSTDEWLAHGVNGSPNEYFKAEDHIPTSEGHNTVWQHQQGKAEHNADYYDEDEDDRPSFQLLTPPPDSPPNGVKVTGKVASTSEHTPWEEESSTVKDIDERGRSISPLVHHHKEMAGDPPDVTAESMLFSANSDDDLDSDGFDSTVEDFQNY